MKSRLCSKKSQASVILQIALYNSYKVLKTSWQSWLFFRLVFTLYSKDYVNHDNVFEKSRKLRQKVFSQGKNQRKR